MNKERPIRAITLLRGQTTIVDADDLPDLQKYTWYLCSNGYVYARIDGKPVALHVYLMRTPRGMHTDHINRDKLDNRRSNLRICTPQENLANRRSFAGQNNPFYGKTHSAEVKRQISQRWAKPVLQLSKDGQILRRFPSTLAAERETGIRNGNISSACLGRYKTAGGYKWMYEADR